MNNLLSYCGLIDAKIRASDKDLPVNYVILFLSGAKGGLISEGILTFNPYFDRSVNPISTRGNRLCPPICLKTLPPCFFFDWLIILLILEKKKVDHHVIYFQNKHLLSIDDQFCDWKKKIFICLTGFAKSN